jgi:hypothetical protein
METPMETEKKYFTFVLQRLRVRLRRTGPATSLSHLQQIDAIRRTLRSAGWPVWSMSSPVAPLVAARVIM